jgi:PAS domain S-box-containing protein
MRRQDVEELVQSTGDAAFAVDRTGAIVAWNKPAENLFGIPAAEARDRPCNEVVRGRDECAPVCSSDCWIFLNPERPPLRSFDLQVETKQGAAWCSVSVLGTDNGTPDSRFSIHLFSRIGMAKQLELTVRDFLASQTNLSPEDLRKALGGRKDYVAAGALTPREREVLRQLALGGTTSGISQELSISRATVNNHVQHILCKLGAHSRMEAVRRAESAGIL